MASAAAATAAATSAAAKTRAVVNRVMPRIGDMTFGTFSSFAALLFTFTAFTDIILCIVYIRANELDQPFFPVWIFVLNVLWMVLQAAIFGDLIYVYYRYYFPRAQDAERPKIADSPIRQPKAWHFGQRCLNLEINPGAYLLMLSLLLPLNALLFYQGLGSPIYTPTRLATYNVTELLEPGHWPQGSGLAVDLDTWEVSMRSGAFQPRLVITSRNCYRPASAEYLLLGRLQGSGNWSEPFPKQAYCEALLGTMVAGTFGDPVDLNAKTWMQDQDKWNEAFEFGLRLFTSLAGVVADQADGDNTVLSMLGLSFLKDMTDVFDMYMLTFADVDQLLQGRPILSHNTGIPGSTWSYHQVVFVCIWMGVFFVLMRALAILGFSPLSNLMVRLRCRLAPHELREPIDAICSLFFLEIPYLVVRWIAWRYYGVSVSLMAVKNLLGIWEDLFFLGIMSGFGGDKPRGIRLWWSRRCSGSDAKEGGVEAGPAGQGSAT